MSEAQTSYGLHRHKYKVDDIFDFDGEVAIRKILHELSEQGYPMYEVKMDSGEIKEVDEYWIDAGIDHFNLDEHGRKQDAEYGVSYIAEAPQEFKVGDRVEIEADVEDVGKNAIGFIQSLNAKDDTAFVYIRQRCSQVAASVPTKYLRKLPDTDNPLDRQVGGSHYKDMAIQPIEFSMKNGLNACQHSIIKYICRYKHKNGKEDLLKAKHFIDLLIQLEYPE